MAGKLLQGKPALFDTFCGLVPCKVIKIYGTSPNPTSAVMVEFEISIDWFNGQNQSPIYKKGERLKRSSLHVVPKQAIRRTSGNCYIQHYTVGM
jgi:hypothetical protein